MSEWCLWTLAGESLGDSLRKHCPLLDEHRWAKLFCVLERYFELQIRGAFQACHLVPSLPTSGSCRSEFELDDHDMKMLSLRFISVFGSNMMKIRKGSKTNISLKSWFSGCCRVATEGFCCLKQLISSSKSVSLLAADEFLRLSVVQVHWSVLWVMLWAAADLQEQFLSCSLLHRQESFTASPTWMKDKRSWTAFRWLQGWVPIVRAF